MLLHPGLGAGPRLPAHGQALKGQARGGSTFSSHAQRLPRPRVRGSPVLPFWTGGMLVSRAPPPRRQLTGLAHREAVFIFQPLNRLLRVPCHLLNAAGTLTFRPSARPPLEGSASKVVNMDLSGRNLAPLLLFLGFHSTPRASSPPFLSQSSSWGHLPPCLVWGPGPARFQRSCLH